MKIVFVCTGNTCRSPMAEHLLEDLLNERELSDINVASAGVSARSGKPPARQTLSVLKKEGINSIQSHQSQHVSDIDFEDGDLVLTMTRGHKERLSDLPDGVTVNSLKEFIGEGGNITDPYGQPEAVYRDLYEELNDHLQKLVDDLPLNDD